MGGMAEIFRARTATEGFTKRVCIKRVLPNFLEEPEFVTMFRDEAQTAAKLQHVNVVQVFDFGEVEDESGTTLYLAMELVDGADLRRIAEAGRRKNLPFSLGEVVQIGIDVCRGLHHAHTLTEDGRPLGIVHRDISPHNVLVSRNGEVKVADFGIARAAERATHTSTGIVKGKIGYMSPEQAEGRPFDHRLDQWALGVVLWELLCGARLFTGENDVAILRRVIARDVAPPSDRRAGIPPALDDIVMRALAAQPRDRFPDLRAMEQALQRLLFSGAIDPGSADVRALFPRILEAQSGPPQPVRRTQVAVVDPVVAAPSLSTFSSSSSASSPSSSPAPPMERADALPKTVSAPPAADPSRASSVFTDGHATVEQPPTLPSTASDPQVAAPAGDDDVVPRLPRARSDPPRRTSSPPIVVAGGAVVPLSPGGRSDPPRRTSSPPSEGAPAAGDPAVAPRLPADDDGTPATRTVVPAAAILPAAVDPRAPATGGRPRAAALVAAATAGVVGALGLAGALRSSSSSSSSPSDPPTPVPAVRPGPLPAGSLSSTTTVPGTIPAPDVVVPGPPEPSVVTGPSSSPPPAAVPVPLVVTPIAPLSRPSSAPPAPSSSVSPPAPARGPAASSLPAAARLPVPALAGAPVAPSSPPSPSSSPPSPSSSPSSPAASGVVYVDLVGGWGKVFSGPTFLGETPTQLRLPAGRHTLTLQDGATGQTRSIVVLVPPGGRVQIRESF